MLLDIWTKFEDYKYIREDNDDAKNEKIDLISAKNDWAAFQLLIKCNEDITVSLGGTPVFSPKGDVANIRLAANVENLKCDIIVQAEDLVKDDDGKHKADILLNGDSINLTKNEVLPVWVEIRVPKEASEGDYMGGIRVFCHNMFEDEKELKVVPFSLKVYDAVMPEHTEYSFYLDLWQHVSNISRKHETVLFSDDHF